MNTRGGLFRLQVSDLSKLAEGFYSDGGNLYLEVERNKAGDGFYRRWIFRYQLPNGGRQRDMGTMPCVNTKPPRASASMLGVGASGCPAKPKCS